MDGTPLATVNAVEIDSWIEVDVTGLVSGDGSDSPDNVMYSSKDNPNGNFPELIVEMEPREIEARSVVMDTFKIGPTDDAFVVKTFSKRNYGDHVQLKVDLDNGFKKTYLRFDFSRVNIAAVRGVILRLYATDDSPSGGTFLTATDSHWDEEHITFENAPYPDGVFLGTLSDIKKDNWYEIEITKAVTRKGPLTICILGIHEDRVMYGSKESEHSPEVLLAMKKTVPNLSRGAQLKEIVASDDATVVLQDPDLNLGDDGTLRADARDGMSNFLLKFDAADVPRGQVKSAVLRIYALNEEPAFGGTFVESRNSGWDEGSVTWSNAPPSDGRVLGSLPEAERGSWLDLDVTNAVMGGSEVSFRVSSPHYLTAVYASRQSGHPPKLVVQYSPPDPVPEGFEVYEADGSASILMDAMAENFGRDETIRVDGHGGVYNSLLRFDLTPVERGTVEEATLRLYAVDGSPSGGTFITTSVSEWEQDDVTWSSAPRADGTVFGTLGPVVPYRWYDVDLSKIASDLGGEPLSVRITPSHGNRCAYSSNLDPKGNKPQLMIKANMFAGMDQR